jgi:hypothetical protein
LVSTPIVGAKSRVIASWKDDTSTTAISGGGSRSASSESAVPMLPPAGASLPASVSR